MIRIMALNREFSRDPLKTHEIINVKREFKGIEEINYNVPEIQEFTNI